MKPTPPQIALAALLALAGSSCATPPLGTSSEVRSAMTYRTDPYRGFSEATTPSFDASDQWLRGLSASLRRLTFNDAPEEPIYVVDFEFIGPDWIFFGAMNDQFGTRFEDRSPRRDVTVGGGITERVSFQLDHEAVGLYSRAGLRARVYGKRGSRDVAVPSHYFSALLP
jgi:hypothetical protein